jgi:hypothetical protein
MRVNVCQLRFTVGQKEKKHFLDGNAFHIGNAEGGI